MVAPLVLRIIGDATSLFKTADATVGSFTKIGDAALATSADVELAAKKQIAANLKVIESQTAMVDQLKSIAATSTATGNERIAINNAVAASQRRLDATLGLTATSTARVGSAAKEGERDLGKLTRGALAGSGVFSALGRSLAFASTGFIAVAGGATLIAASIRAAEELQAAQRRADTQLQTSGKSWAQYGTQIDSVLVKEGHLAGFTRADLLQAFTYLLRVGGNVQNSLKLTGLAADVARGRSISLSAASIALSKALGGSATALRRLGIIVPNNVTKMQALAYVQQKFAGQAEAGTTESERFSASLHDAGATIGTVLLPTFDRLAREISDWLTKMQQSGRLQRDVNALVTGAGVAFHGLEDAIHAVDFVTGSFGKTLLTLGEIWAGIKILGWIANLEKLAATWGTVGAAASSAAVAEDAAIAGGAGGAAGRGGIAGAALLTLRGRSPSALAGRVGMYTGSGVAAEGAASATGVGALAVAALLASQALDSLTKSIADKTGAGGAKSAIDDFFGTITGGLVGNKNFGIVGLGPKLFHSIFPTQQPGVAAPQSVYNRNPTFAPAFFPNLGFSATGRPTGPFGAARPQPQVTGFNLTIVEQIAQAQAAMTASTKDDVTVAKQIIQRIQKILDSGNYTQKGLLALLQAEGSAMDTVKQAAAAAAAKVAARRAAAKAAASTYAVPIALQLAQAKLDAYGKDTTSVLKQIIAAAQKAIASGKKNSQGEIAALQVIAQARSQLQQAVTTFTLPAKLQLQLAKAQALGTDQTGVLKRMKAALERALKKAKGNIALQTDIWNQIYQINQQLGSSAQSAFGDYRKASTQALTRGLGLTAQQRAALRARLSQLGPGGTTPMPGTGAGGYAIDPNTGRPIHIHTHVNIDGKRVADNTTKHQQRRRSRNSSQRRGPNAGG